MKTYPRGDHPGIRGTWFDAESALTDQVVVWFTCPDCGALGMLEDHNIAADGTVTPSVVCPEECGFHEHIQLTGWEGE